MSLGRNWRKHRKKILLLSLYSLIFAFQLTSTYIKAAEISDNLFRMYDENDSERTKFEWGTVSQLKELGLTLGLVAGILSGTLTLLILVLGVQYGPERRYYVALTVFLSNLLVFVAFPAVLDPFIVTSFVYLLYSLIGAGILCLATTFSLYPVAFLKFNDPKNEISYLKLRHAHENQVLHILIWVFIILLGSTVFQILNQTSSIMNLEVRYSVEYGLNTWLSVMLIVNISIGYLIGIVCTIAWKIQSIHYRIQKIDDLSTRS